MARQRPDQRDMMLIAEANVVTERSGRYLVQLCEHVDAITRRHPQMGAKVEWSEDHGLIDFGWRRGAGRGRPAPDRAARRRAAGAGWPTRPVDRGVGGAARHRRAAATYPTASERACP